MDSCDEYYTPKYIFDALNCRFDLDAAATHSAHQCVPADKFIYTNSLKEEWNGFVWCNPPYSGRNSKTLFER